MIKFQKPFIHHKSLLDPKVKDPDGYVTKNGTWAAIPWTGKRKGFCIIHNGRQVYDTKTYKQALIYIKKQSKIKSTSTLEEFL